MRPRERLRSSFFGRTSEGEVGCAKEFAEVEGAKKEEVRMTENDVLLVRFSIFQKKCNFLWGNTSFIF
jgi:hypothetical protein